MPWGAWSLDASFDMAYEQDVGGEVLHLEDQTQILDLWNCDAASKLLVLGPYLPT